MAGRTFLTISGKDFPFFVCEAAGIRHGLLMWLWLTLVQHTQRCQMGSILQLPCAYLNGLLAV